jgi:hypothetical protein
LGVKVTVDQRLAAHMKQAAQSCAVSVVEACGIFQNSASDAGITLFPCATYGFAVELTAAEKVAVFNEAQQKNTTKLTNVTNWKPLFDNCYPLYWGHDKMLGARPYQHPHNTKKTGLIRLCAYTALHGKNIAVVTLTVTDSIGLEKELQKTNPPLLITVTRQL